MITSDELHTEMRDPKVQVSQSPVNPVRTTGFGMLGFTMIELMMAIAILAIGLALSVPSIRTISANNQVVVANNSIMTGLNLARSEAVFRGHGVSICPSQNGTACADDEWNTGWIVFDNADGNGNMVEAEVIRASVRSSDITRSGLAGNVVFNPNGTTTLGASTSITVCYDDSTVSNRCRVISINRFGLISSAETTS